MATKKKKTPMTPVERKKTDIEKAFDHHEKDGWKKDAKRFLEYFKGRYHTSRSGRKRYVVNTVFNFVNLIVPNLFFREPFVRVKPKTKNIVRPHKDGTVETIPSWRVATLFESVLNKTLTDIGFADEVRKCVQDCMFYGMGILKVGYGMTTESTPNPEAPESAEHSETPRIQEESVFALRVPPLDFGVDPLATSLGDARYVVHRVTKPLQEIKENDLYQHTKDLSPDGESDRDSEAMEDPKEGDVDSEITTLYEVHDLLENKIVTINKGINKFLREDDNPHDFTGSHFVILKYSGDNDEFRGIPFIGMIEDEAIALNDAVTRMLNHLEIFPGQVMVEEGAMDEDEIMMMKDGTQGSILSVQNGALREGRIQKQSPLPMGSEYFNVVNQLQILMDSVLGIPDFQRPKGTTRKTATEATFEQSDSAIRREYFLGFTKVFMLNAVGKIAALIQQYYDRDREIRIEGDTGIEFVRFTKDDIAGEFDFDFSIQDMRFVPQARAQQLINALNIMAAHPTLQPMLQDLDPKLVAKQLFQQLDLDIEMLKRNQQARHLEMNPEFENQLALAGKRIPDPKPGEDHKAHNLLHLPVYEQTKSDELLRHMQMHEFLHGVQNGTIDLRQLQQRSQQPVGTLPGETDQATTASNGAGGSAGFQDPGSPARTEPELAGGFFGNQ